MQTHLVQEAFGLEVTPGQVRVGFAFPADRSGNLEVYHVLEAFDDLRRTNGAVTMARGRLQSDDRTCRCAPMMADGLKRKASLDCLLYK